MIDAKPLDIFLTSLAVGAVLIIFATVWRFACPFLSKLSGWHALAEKFTLKADQNLDPATAKYSMQRGRIGLVGYKNILSVQILDSGIHLAVFPLFRPGHPPLLIPWKEVRNLREKEMVLDKMCEFEVGEPSIATIALPHKVLQPAQRLIEENRDQ